MWKKLSLAIALLTAAIATADESRTNRVLENPVQDGDIIFRVNDGGVKTDAMTVDGATSTIKTTQAPDFGDLSNIWTSGGIYPINGLGLLYTHGSFGVSLIGNGYRNNSGLWTTFNANSQLGATKIDLLPSGTINFGTDATKNNGDSPSVTTRMSINSAGAVSIGGTTSIADTLSLTKTGGPHIYIQSNAANNTTKGSYIDFAQYASATYPTGYLAFYGFSDSTTNRVYYGGGSSVGNAATEHRFYTAANNTTAGNSATERMSINSSGVVDISGSLTLGTALAVTEGGTGATSAANARTNLGIQSGVNTGSVSGCTVATTMNVYYQVIGSIACMSFEPWTCTSNAANLLITMSSPLIPSASGDGFTAYGIHGQSNSVDQTDIRCQLGSGADSTIDCRQSAGGSLFDATGTKGIDSWTICYDL